ncbi:GAF and ANTAR domain-containing protein [Lentzea sp. NPDC004782]|uniref:GAF and ANTAR domain-containing protein n=1 Tax=Lentzea sp. NPDC004782 TaxID=3154458 RepID=UPI0033B45407
MVRRPVDHERVARAWAAIRQRAQEERVPVAVGHVCAACAASVGARGVGLTLARGRGRDEPVCSVGPGTDELEEMQFTLGEGPAADAAARRSPVLVADLAGPESGHRWPMFARAAARHGVRAMISVPLRAGAIEVGVLSAYLTERGVLSDDRVADVLVYADAAMLLVLSAADGIATGQRTSTGNGFDERRAEVHQAAGMISVQLGVGVEEALVRLRAHAYAQDRRLVDVARDVVERRLRFSRDATVDTNSDIPSPGKEEDR